MTDIRTVLKNAFIEAQLDNSQVVHHEFSPEFELKMQQLIKSQRGIRKLLNTAAKRVACIALAVLICLTTVACSIKDVREPIIEEIQNFFVNAKEILTGTKADDVSGMFPSDVTKIIGTSYISQTQNQYVIDDKEKITDFIKLLAQTYWGEPERFDDFDEINTYWSFDFFNVEDKSVFQIKMCNDISSNSAKIVLVKGNKEKRFYISNKVYKEILAFTNRKFYLHDSPIDEIDNEFFEKHKIKCLSGLDEGSAEKVKERIRKLHYELEYIIETVQDNETKAKLEEALNIWKKAMAERDLEGCFKAHTYIHDYDYFAFNYPTRYVYSEFADYQGVNDYFGILEQ